MYLVCRWGRVWGLGDCWVAGWGDKLYSDTTELGSEPKCTTRNGENQRTVFIKKVAKENTPTEDKTYSEIKESLNRKLQ